MNIENIQEKNADGNLSSIVEEQIQDMLPGEFNKQPFRPCSDTVGANKHQIMADGEDWHNGSGWLRDKLQQATTYVKGVTTGEGLIQDRYKEEDLGKFGSFLEGTVEKTGSKVGQATTYVKGVATGEGLIQDRYRQEDLGKLGSFFESKIEGVGAKADQFSTWMKDTAVDAIKNPKKYAMSPFRGAFLVLLRFNVYGLAKKISLARVNKPSQYQILLRQWENWGGNTLEFAEAAEKAKDKMDGRYARREERRGFDGELNIAGVDDAAVIAAAITAGSALAAKILSMIGDKADDKRDQEFLEQQFEQQKYLIEAAEDIQEPNDGSRDNPFGWFDAYKNYVYIGGGVLLAALTATYFIIKKKK